MYNQQCQWIALMRNSSVRSLLILSFLYFYTSLPPLPPQLSPFSPFQFKFNVHFFVFSYIFACLYLSYSLFLSISFLFFVSINSILICLLYSNANSKKKISSTKKKHHIICRYYKVEVSCVQINWSVHLNWMWQQFGYRKVKIKSFLFLFQQLTHLNVAINLFGCHCFLPFYLWFLSAFSLLPFSFILN